MKLAGSHTFAFPRDVVWAALMDPAVLARTLPGCERLERAGGEDRLVGVLQVAIGPVKGQFQGTLDMTELRPPESYRMRLDGQGSSGFVKGEGVIRLEEAPEGTLLSYDLDAEVGGRLAGVGQRLLESSAKSIARQGLAGLEQQLRQRQESAQEAARALAGAAAEAVPPAGEGPVSQPAPDSLAGEAVPTTAPPSPPSAVVFAGRVARDVAADLVPPAARRWLLVAVVGVVVLGALLIARSCG